MSWPRDLITWSYLSSSNNILLSPHLLTTLSLPTSHILPLQNIALTRSAPTCITSRHPLIIPISLTSRCLVLTFPHLKPNENRITIQSLAVEKRTCNGTSLGWYFYGGRDSSSQAPCLRNFHNKAKIYDMLDTAKHGSLISVWLFYKRSWLHWCRSKAFTIKSNKWGPQREESPTQLLKGILDRRLWQCTRHQRVGRNLVAWPIKWNLRKSIEVWGRSSIRKAWWHTAKKHNSLGW